MDLVIIALFWIFCGWLVMRRSIVIAIGASIAMMPFGAMSVIPVDAVGGLTLLPSSVLGMIGIGHFLASKPGRTFIVESGFSLQKLGLLTAFLGITVGSAFFYPRIFAGMVEVVPMYGNLSGYAGGWTRLFPSTQNFTQLCYLSVSIMAIFCFAFMMQYPRYQQVILKAFLIAGVVNVVAGTLDYASLFVDLSFILEPFRTAQYALLVEAEVLNGKRVVGLMPEASAFGPMCVTQAVLLLMWRDAFESPRIRLVVPTVVVPMLFLFAFLSTSSAAFLAMGVSIAVLVIRAVKQQLLNRKPIGAGRLVSWPLFAIGSVVALVFAYGLVPEAFSGVEYILDKFVVNKTGTSSFDERMTWNQISLEALVGTYGIGVGIGGTRASSLLVSIVTNVGIPGAVFFLLFVLKTLLGRKIYLRRSDAILCQGGLWAFVPLISAGILTATSPDFGMGIASILGVHAACGAVRRRPVEAATGKGSARGRRAIATEAGDPDVSYGS